MVSLRSAAFLLLASFGLHAQQTCTGLCLQQVQCPAGSSTTVTGTVYAPNGVDPIPNVSVYIPNAPVDPLPAGVACPVPGQLPSGSPLVGAFSAADGTFTLNNVPVGNNIPLVIVAGKWRRQLAIPGTAACGNTTFNARFPKNQSEGDIPKFAISTGNADQVECVLRKVGIEDAEFTNPSGGGRIQLYQATDDLLRSPGARIDVNTPSTSTLMGNSTVLNSYDVLMLPCEGAAYTQPALSLTNLVAYANAGGRVYGSHYAYQWFYQNSPFNTVASWTGSGPGIGNVESATVDPTFPGGVTLTKWLQVVNASSGNGKVTVNTVKKDFNGINAPTQSWLTLDRTGGVAQFTFATPVGQTSNQCGRVLFNEYHVETVAAGVTALNATFPTECSTGTMTPQEKLLEYSLFDLANNGGPATMTPASADFGNQAVGYQTASKTFTITNNSVFSATLTSSGITGDYLITGNSCSAVMAGGTCTVQVAFKPTDIGPRTGTLSITFGGTDLTASLTGNGVPPLSISAASLDFGSVDVTASASRVVTITNAAPGALPLPAFTVTGDYKAVPSCPAVLPIGGSCPITITFTPTTTGTRNGTLTATGISTTLTGNGVDFALAMSPDAGTVIAGLSKTPSLTTSPIAGFSAPVTLTCTTDVPASTCSIANSAFTPTSPVTTTITITTTSQYKLIGYGVSGNLLLALVSVGTTVLLYRGRRTARSIFATMALVVTGFACMSLTGCSGKEPAQNAAYSPAGTYSVTVSATDGTLTHTAVYKLTVTAK